MKFVKSKSRSLVLTLSFIGALLSYSAMADDTEIFFSESVTSVNPNVMFVVDVSGSMDEEVTGSDGQSRLTVMQNALKTVLKSAPDNLNVGLMNYGEIKYHDEGHGVKFPITDITAFAEPVVREKLKTNEWGYTEWWNSSIPKTDPTTTVRSYLSEITNWYWKDNWYTEVIDNNTANEMDHVGVTPIVDALYEAAMYFRGEDVSFGLGSIGYWNRWAAHQSTYEGEPVTWDEELCESSYVRTHDAPIDFTNEEQPWYRCPADAVNPQSPGTYENCQNNEVCTTETETNCKEWVYSYCTEEVVDEGGANNCAEGKRVEGYCKNEEYETLTVEKCKYNICEGGYSSKPRYRTPIKQACQSNFIVLLSDGKPQYSYSFDNEGNRDGTNSPPPTFEKLESGEFPAMIDLVDSTNKFDHTSCASNQTPNGYRSGACGPEMTKFLSKADNSDLEGVQTIDTYAIGFGLDGEASAQDYLKSLVSTDDPATPEVEGYFSAEDEVQLSQAFSNILEKISSTTTSFASPGYSVDLKTGLFNEEDIYIPVFDKSLSPRWSGNLKKFKLAIDANGKSSVVDKYDKLAVDNLGVFTEEAVDVWSKSTSGDGRDVSKGGVAQLIDPNKRKAYTDIACDKNSNECDFLNIAKNRIHPDNDISVANGAITNEILGLDEDETKDTRINMLNFILGRKLNNETGAYDLSPHMGDMLHTEPVVVTYDKNYKDTTNGQVIYAATNEGYLHAFDTVTGKEIFAFMPSSLMKNIPTQYYNSSIGKHAYGIDGIMSKRVERDKDGNITKVLLYFGLRRGGREYYALDVTQAANPKLLWKIDALAQEALDEKKSCKKSAKSKKSEKTECTVDGIIGKGDFAKLGQSWSTPYLAKIRTSDRGFKDVVIFSGGYDINQDKYQSDRNDTDTVGNEIFIVDAKNGNLIWSANNSALKHSIPGGMRILDMNQDGAIDRMYFADTGGNVWRLELPMGPNYDLAGSKLIKFAKLGGKSSDNRMFYNEPDVALLKSKGVNWLTIALGSGYRAHPADNEVDDNFYVLLDNAVNTPLTEKIDKSGDFKTLESRDLEVITISDITGAPSINRDGIGDKTILDPNLNKAGWYLEMPSTGEKVLAPSITSEGSVMFTTLVPPDSGADLSGRDLCEAPITQGRFYSFNILTAEAGSDVNNSGTVTDIDVMTVVTANEIPGSPQRIFNKPTCKGMECTQLVDIRVGKRAEALTTYDASLLESVFWTNPNRK